MTDFDPLYPHERPVDARFLKGPIPWRWLAVAMALPGKALAVAIRIWLTAGMRRALAGLPLNLSRVDGVDRCAARRGLRALERAGLVTVDRGRGRKAIVSIIMTTTHRETM